MLFLKIITVLLPWKLKRFVLIKIFGFEIHPCAEIGLSWIFPKFLKMEAFAKIDHFTVAIHLDEIRLDEYSKIGRSNWITGFPSNLEGSTHFVHQKSNRFPILQVGKHSSITKNHHLDCTNKISIGCFSTVAGYSSQFLTHSINIVENRQDSAPIIIGDYCFIGTNAVILGGACLPSYCVLGAKSLLNKKFIEEYFLYAGVPAQRINEITPNAKYFKRESGFVL
jgi:acetyltransferase-like isoleucine patch superfamily enzyme